MRYCKCPRHIKIYRWWRYRPLGMLKAIIGILLWISMGAPLPKDDLQCVSPTYCNSRWLIIKWTFQSFKGLADSDMQNTAPLKESIARLKEKIDAQT